MRMYGCSYRKFSSKCSKKQRRHTRLQLMQDTRERETVRQNLSDRARRCVNQKVAYGTQGVKTKVPESKLTLQIALKLEKELKKRGYDVYMIRRKQNVNISNKQRAIRANKSGADICIRLHADAASANVRGVSVLYPSQQNPYVAKLARRVKTLKEYTGPGYC